MGIGFSELAVILVVVLIVFGAGKLPGVLGDLGKGVKAFKEGMDGEPAPKKKPAAKRKKAAKKGK
ncbi:MAG: twin-arginine translocase TatA/TatE family subunit [Proteobacteria bacterium]|nr:twin-arginine translocase TatA/TatE family subunit [Pseudomonadota bacterium]